MTDTPLPTKDRLILTAAQAPKGSLYHHFTNGKSDLALAAATWVLDGLLRVIAASFEPTDSFDQGARTLFHKLAKLFDLSGHWDGSPISAILFEGPDNAVFRAHAAHLFEGWISEVAHRGERLGLAPDAAQEAAETLYILIQGGSRSRRSSDVILTLPDRLVLFL